MIEADMLFQGWQNIRRTLIVGLLAYVALVLFLRISGKRTLAKLNAFDLVVTVALGSTYATVLLSASVPLSEGILALALLVSLQFVITWLSVRSPVFRTLVKSEPTLLVHESRYLEAALRQQRVTHDEIGAALRASGRTDLSEVGSVVLETDGSLTVVPRGPTL